MKSNYKRIGNYIELVDERNKELNIDLLLGLSISKQFIPSVANTIGADMKNYKIIRKGQFACSIMQVRRDGKMPVALLEDYEEAIISQAYPVFRVIDETKLLPEYLMMWFSRSEFDRQATFHAVGGVRGSLDWDDFLDFELPIPSLEKQQEIVNEYNTITNRISLNEQLNQKLEETAQALYKHWFVDFEFPNEEGKPYKSSGGKMVYNEELDTEIPEGWGVDYLGTFVNVENGFAFKSSDFNSTGNIPIIKIKNITPPIININECQFFKNALTSRLQNKIVNYGDILISMTGSSANQMDSAVGQVGRYYNNKVSLLNQRVGKLEILNEIHKEFIYQFIKDEDTHMELLNGSTGSANQANVSPDQIKNLKIIKSTNNILEKFQVITEIFFKAMRINNQDILMSAKELILSKMTKVEVEEEIIN